MITTTNRTDSQLKTDVLAELACDITVDETEVGVQCKNGVVTLTGSVHSWVEKNAVERTAGFMAGVKRVDDRITVDPYQ